MVPVGTEGVGKGASPVNGCLFEAISGLENIGFDECGASALLLASSLFAALSRRARLLLNKRQDDADDKRKSGNNTYYDACDGTIRDCCSCVG